MEHRHFPRHVLQMAAQLCIDSGTVYPVSVLDMSAIGMRISIKSKLPDRIKLVDVLLKDSLDPYDPTYRFRMYVARKEGQELGLCLVSETARIELNGYSHDMITTYEGIRQAH
ncbi:MAG: hypothetical protein GC149_16950 [Gammaproteobacteria bacterium]|nr:hypothetical protein [Gammaproteobacteria bacterium]